MKSGLRSTKVTECTLIAKPDELKSLKKLKKNKIKLAKNKLYVRNENIKEKTYQENILLM
jgi:hypothetical protein